MPSPFPGMNPYLEQERLRQDFHRRMIPSIADALSPLISPNYVVMIQEHICIHEPRRCPMPSPFPGMNPYLEQEHVWQDFHDTMIPMIRERLSPQVSPNYLVKIEEHIYIHEPAAEQRIRAADVEIEHETFLEIRDRDDNELITVIELLSPTNKKAGPDRDQFLSKRLHILRSSAHYVEIDLLRGWQRMPCEQASSCDYCVLVSRVEGRPQAGFWPVRLRDKLPKIPIPLRPPHADAYLDLQEVLHGVYDRAYYKDYIYKGKPTPALSASDGVWADSVLQVVP